MRTRKKPVVLVRLAKIRKRFESWRSRNRPRTRIPEELWTAAVDFAREIRKHRTVKALMHCRYQSLPTPVVGEIEPTYR